MATTTLAPPIPTPGGQARLLQWLRFRQLRNSLGVVFRQSAVRALTVVLCSAFIWLSVFGLSYLGFASLKYTKSWDFPLDGQIMVLLFNLMFLTLTVLLVFSTALIMYSSLFASPETAFLLSGPLTADQIFAHKYQAAVGFSSWAFVLLGSPILLAYGLLVNDGPEHVSAARFTSCACLCARAQACLQASHDPPDDTVGGRTCVQPTGPVRQAARRSQTGGIGVRPWSGS